MKLPDPARRYFARSIVITAWAVRSACPYTTNFPSEDTDNPRSARSGALGNGVTVTILPSVNAA